MVASKLLPTDQMRNYPEKLFDCWHPVAYASELPEGKPFGTSLLDEPIVIWRSSDRTTHAMKDLCIHRGTALSLGWIDNDNIVCAYHGWRYNGDGACVHIPQKEKQTIPRKARATSYACVERYGLIWVCLGEATYSLPDVPELETSSWKVVETGPFEWQCDASRQVENFTDFGHFPWVHPGLLGDRKRPVVPDYEVTTEGHILRYSIVRPEAPNSDDFPIFANDDIQQPERRSVYQLHLPYTIILRLGWGGDEGMVYFFASQPVSHNSCRGYCTVARNYDLEKPETVIQEFEEVIFSQDKRVVESQRPEQVPFDLSDELHLTFDAVALNYRRAMEAEGLSNQSV